MRLLWGSSRSTGWRRRQGIPLKPNRLTPRQERLAHEFVVDRNATAAVIELLSARISPPLPCRTRLTLLAILRLTFDALACPRQQRIATGSNINDLASITTFHIAEVTQPIYFVVVRLGRSLSRLFDNKFKRPKDQFRQKESEKVSRKVKKDSHL